MKNSTPCEEYTRDKELTVRRTKELGSLEYQCRTCANTKCHFMKVARTHFEACKDYYRKQDTFPLSRHK